MSTRTRRSLAAIATLAFAAACSPDQAPPTAAGPAAEPRTAAVQPPGLASLLEVTLALPDESLVGDGAVPLTVTIANRSARTVVVPAWMLPVDDVEEALFDVRRDGLSVPYVGPDVKRGPLQAADLVRFAPGESRTYTVDLGAAYDLSLDGVYRVAYAVERGVGTVTYRLQSEPTAVTLSGRSGPTALAMPMGPAREVTALAGSLSFSKCSGTQQATVTTAVANARSYANEASTYLAAQNTTSERFQKWFGSPTVTANWDRIRSNFAKIEDGFTNQAVVVDCGCKQNYYAYVYSNRPYKIYVCRVFWSAPMTGTDSKAGTLIHEMSHFTVVAGTSDWAYGQTAAANLALTNVSRALSNADNHEYFAENTPVLK